MFIFKALKITNYVIFTTTVFIVNLRLLVNSLVLKSCMISRVPICAKQVDDANFDSHITSKYPRYK